MNITLVIKEPSPRCFEVTATCGKDSAVGTGHSAYVAAGRAVTHLVQYAGNRQDPTAPTEAVPVVGPPPTTPVKEFYLRSGRRQGQTCMYLADVAKFEDGTEMIEVEYQDGSTGHEHTKYLNVISTDKK